MQKNEDSGVSEFKRVKPKPVPENWQEEYSVFDAKYREISDRVAAENNGIYPHGPLILPKRNEAFSYFETFMTVPEVTSAVLQISRAMENDHLDSIRWSVGNMRLSFRKWWLQKYTDFSVYDIGQMLGSRFNGIIAGAEMSYVQGWSIENCYKLIEQRLEYWNIVD